MKKSSIITLSIAIVLCIAIFIFTANPLSIPIAIFCVIVCIVVSCKKKRLPLETTEQPRTLDMLITEHGEPDDTIITDPTRAEEPQGAILVYHMKGIMVYQDRVIKKSDIIGLTFNNSTNPYLATDYQVIITTNNKTMPQVRLYVGNDADWAKTVVANIRYAIDKKAQTSDV